MKKCAKNSMVVKIVLAVVVGIILAVFSVTAIIVNLSEDIFVNTYGKSQEKVFLQIEKELNHYHENLSKTLYLIFDYPYKYYTFKLFEV